MTTGPAQAARPHTQAETWDVPGPQVRSFLPRASVSESNLALHYVSLTPHSIRPGSCPKGTRGSHEHDD